MRNLCRYEHCNNRRDTTGSASTPGRCASSPWRTSEASAPVEVSTQKITGKAAEPPNLREAKCRRQEKFSTRSKRGLFKAGLRLSDHR